jgi:hypothetical protein
LGESYLVQLHMSFDGETGPQCDEWKPLRRDGSPWPPTSAIRVLPVLCEVAAIDAVAVRILPSEDGQMGYAILDGDPDRTRSVRLATSPGRRSCPLAQVASVYSDGVDTATASTR